MYFVYIIQSKKNKRYYIGSTGNLRERLSSHNSGKVKSTKSYRPWRLILSEEYENKYDALKRERQIKSYKSGEAFKRLITERWQSG